METERISQFEDQPVVADCVFEYTEDLRAGSVPIVIDNGCTDYLHNYRIVLSIVLTVLHNGAAHIND